ncbi:MAG: NUDIX hydrolase [Elusimicrobiota bacterium]
MKLKETLLKRRRIYTGKSLDFSADIVLLPNGKRALREYAEHPSAVAVVPFIEKNTFKFHGLNDLLKQRIILVRQFRFPIGKITYEIPAGKLDRAVKETPEDCVRREIEEETGYYAKSIKKLISYWPAPAFSTEMLHIFAAYDMKKTGKLPDKDEFLETHIAKFGDVLRLIQKNKIRDSKTIISLLFLYYLVSTT